MSDRQHSLNEIVKRLSDNKLPPVEKWNPDFCGKIDMRIKSDGSWHYMGSPIGRERLVRLFSTVLRRDGDIYYLVTPVEKLEITVDDAPFVATTMDVIEEGGRNALYFTTNVGDEVLAGPDNPITVKINEKTGEPRPYIHIRKGLNALISRSVFYEVVAAAEEGGENGDELVITSLGERFSLGKIAHE